MNKIKDKALGELYTRYNSPDVTPAIFRDYCVNMIQTARAPNNAIIESLKTATRKEAMLTMVNNFAMKGQGFGVIR